MLFSGFKKCLHPTQKFDSDPERRFTLLLEKDSSVITWFKPGKDVFQIRYTGDNDYEPDFVVETEKLLCEPKRAKFRCRTPSCLPRPAPQRPSVSTLAITRRRAVANRGATSSSRMMPSPTT